MAITVDCKSTALGFVGSSPTSGTIAKTSPHDWFLLWCSRQALPNTQAQYIPVKLTFLLLQKSNLYIQIHHWP